MRYVLAIVLTVIVGYVAAAEEKPLYKDFLGINGHYGFKPELYKQCCTLVRNYHNMNWDVEKIGDPITVPMCANNVHWKNNLYGKWRKHNFEIDICMQFGGSLSFGSSTYIKEWNDNLDWAYEYGKRTAEYFGPSGTEKICTSIEFGNEPGRRFDHETYKKLFKKVAQGIRDGDAAVKIVTATTHARTADDYSLDIRNTYADKDILPLYDVINLHTYAQIERKDNSESPWNRSYPEDGSLAYFKVVDEAIEWRNTYAQNKEIWVTEFGYDCVTEEAMKKRQGWFKKLDWQGTTDLQQAQYIVRSIFLFAEREIDRAYIYFFDDSDKASIHAGAGLTRNFIPKQSFWAVKQSYQLLGDYRFSKVIQKENDAYVYEYKHGSEENSYIWIAWSPTGTQTHKKKGYVGKQAEVILTRLPAPVQAVHAMAVTDGSYDEQPYKKSGSKTMTLTVTESPCYIILKNKGS